MPTPPYAQVTVSVNSGSYASGGITVPSAAFIAFAMASTVGVTSQLWEIYSYPDGWACPSGWTNVGGSYQSTSVVPTAVTLPANTSPQWGKFMLRLTVNGNAPAGSVGLVDEATALSMLSSNGVTDVGYNEGRQFSVDKEWVDSVQASLRTLVTLVAGISPPTRQTLSRNGSIVFSSIKQPVEIVCTSNSVAATIPAASDCQVLGPVTDPGNTWGTHAATLVVGAGVSIESPIGGAIVINGPLSLPASIPGTPTNSYSWEYNAAHTLWKLV